MSDKKHQDQIIGANIRREREKAGYTQERFSELIGLGPKSLSAAERGLVGISLSTLRKICQVLSVPSDRILFGAMQEQDVEDIAERLRLLSPKQLEIARAMLGNLLEAFVLGQEMR